MAVIGIDLGTQFSKVAVAYCNTISMVPNDLFQLSTPTLIGYTEKQREFGDAAETSFLRIHNNTISQIKRYLGRCYDDSKLHEELHKWNYCQFKPSNDEHDNHRDRLLFEVTTSEGVQELTSEQILGAYLRKLKELTLRYLEGGEIAHCVIACPIYFTDAQRRSVMAAATLAGWSVSHLLHEPTAVAIAYSMSRKLEKSRRVMFVDMGYSNTQISVVDFGPSHLQMYAVSSDPFLGARDFDYALFDYFRNQFEKQHHIDLSQYPRARIRLMKGVERVKQLLTANKDAIHMLECLVNDIDFNLRITRQEFEILCEPLLYKLSRCVQNAIDAMHVRDAKTYTNASHPPPIHSVEIVGGGTRIRSVQERLLRTLKQYLPECQIAKCSTTLNGDECVARGAALMCAKESPVFRVRELQVQDINNWPVLLKYPAEALGDLTSIDQQIVFPLYSACPDITKVLFDQKKSFKVAFEYPREYKGDGYSLKYPINCNLGIGEFQVSKAKIPRSESIAFQTQLILTLNKHGLLEMPQAQLVETSTTDQEAELLNFSNPGKGHITRKIIQTLHVTGRFFSEISKEKLNEWMDLENRLATADQIIKETNDQRNELETYVYDMRNKLENSHKDLISEPNKKKFLKYLDDVEQWLYDEGKNVDKITYLNKLQELKKISDRILGKPEEAKPKQPPSRPIVPSPEIHPALAQSTIDEKRDELSKELTPKKPKSRQSSPAREKQIPLVNKKQAPPTREREDNHNEDEDNDFFQNDFFQRKKRPGSYLQDLADFLSDF